MKTVLVSGGSGVVGYGILKSLRRYDKTIRLISTSIYPISVASRFCDDFELVPSTCDAEYYPKLTTLIQKYNVDVLIPGIEIDMHSWSIHENLINRLSRVVLNQASLIRLCKDKWQFYLDLSHHSDPVLIPTYEQGDFHQLSDLCGIPFLLKPKQGYGSKGIVKVDKIDVFRLYEKRMGIELIAQPIVGTDQDEYSVSCFGDGNGAFLNIFSLRRKLGAGGFTEFAEVVNDDLFLQPVSRLCSYYKPIGPTNFQFRLHNGELKLLEINPRISSATSIRAAFGYNEAGMAVEYFLNGISPEVPMTTRGTAIRFMEDHILTQ